MNNIRRSEPYTFFLICQSYPPIIGGSELEAQRVCEALIRRGHRVTVVCSGGAPMPPVRNWVDLKGVPVRIYARYGKGAVKNCVFAIRVAFMLILERKNYQFVYFLMPGLHLAAGLPVARVLGKPTLMKFSGSGEVTRMTKSIIGRFELWMLRRWVRCLMILNEGMRQEAIAHGFPPDLLLWMPNPVDTDQFSPGSGEVQLDLRIRFDIPPGSTVVLYCGRLAPEKALPSLIDAFSLLTREFPDAFLVLIGDGPLRGSLEQKAKQLNLTAKNVRFAGQVDPDEVCSWLKVADVFVLPSFLEGFPCSLIEAMSAGLPSVVSDIPANQQLVKDGEQGLLVPAGDAKATAKSLKRLFEDPHLRTQMGRAARQTILENYATSHIVCRYEDLFGRTLQDQ